MTALLALTLTLAFTLAALALGHLIARSLSLGSRIARETHDDRREG